MIFINHQKSASAAKDYYTQHIAPGDGRYYAEENAQQMKGVWHGRGAEMLQLSGEVQQEDFFKLCDNLNPATGEQLTMRNDTDRRVMTDITFDVPKSVTLAYELGGDDRILEAFQTSARETMADMEREVQTRVRKNGADHDRTTGNIIWAEHIHKTARPVTADDKQTVDPQLHMHATVFNATYDDTEKRWKAIQLGDIVRDKGYYQAAFHGRLASKLKGLGYGIEKHGNSFTIAGIDRAAIEKFSKRHGVINDEAERLGTDDPASRAKIARRSREKKNQTPQSMADLRAEWEKRITPEERLSITTAGSSLERGDAEITPEKAKEYALEHSFQNASVVSEKRLKQEALTYAVGSVRPEEVADIAQHPEVIAETRGGQLMATTKSVLRDETAMLQFAKDGQRKQKPLFSRSVKSNNSEGTELSGLSDEQRKAALHILNSRDTVTGVVGKAGTGKTTMMRATRDAIESIPGQHVFAFAPSSQAARKVLRNEGFKDAETLAMLLKNEKLQQKLKGQILWVDEAGLVSSKDMRRLMEVAKKGGNRVILSGDYTQHSSVEAGDAFRLVEKEAGVRLARLTQIRRQTTPGYKKAVEQISDGTSAGAQKGFDALDKMGWVIESPATGSPRDQILVKDYLQAVNDGKSALIIAPTHAEGDKLTEELRQTLKERGALGKDREFIARKSTNWSNAQKGDARNYEPGMVVEFNQNVKGFSRGEKVVIIDRGARGAENGTVAQESVAARAGRKQGIAVPKLGRRRTNDAHSGPQSDELLALKEDGSVVSLPLTQAQRLDVFRPRQIAIAKGDRIRITKNNRDLGINNGDIFTVEGFDKEGNINLSRGKYVPKTYGHMSLGYVDTSYSGQGKTVDRVFISVGKESLPAANQQQWYVSASRGREMAKVYVEDKQDVREAIARTGQRLSAVELTHTKLRPSWRDRFHQSLERNRVGRFLKARANAMADRWRGREVTYA